MAEREFDVIICGASGWTGVHVAEYFAAFYADKNILSWALLGRNLSKLQKVRDRIEKLNPSLQNISLIVADSTSQAQIDAVVKRTRVVASTIGPFAQFGEPLVKACAKFGTHYCDITGEQVWVKEMIDKYDKQAKASGAWIIPSCGFDSIPSDLGTLLAVTAVKKLKKANVNCVKDENVDNVDDRKNGEPTRVHVSLVDFAPSNLADGSNGTPGGGTFFSILNSFDASRSSFFNPFLLVPNYGSNTKREAEQSVKNRFPAYFPDINKWTVPWVMAWINDKVVHRSNFLLDDLYGEEFTYREDMGVSNPLFALLITIAYMVLYLILCIPGGVSFLRRFSPMQQSLFPPEKTKDYKPGKFEFAIVATCGEEKAFCSVVGVEDAAWAETAKMLGESAVLLAKNHHKLVEGSGIRGGLLTPAVMGFPLMDRLRGKGMTFTTLSK